MNIRQKSIKERFLTFLTLNAYPGAFGCNAATLLSPGVLREIGHIHGCGIGNKTAETPQQVGKRDHGVLRLLVVEVPLMVLLSSFPCNAPLTPDISSIIFNCMSSSSVMPMFEQLELTCCGKGRPALGRNSITPLKRLHSSAMSFMSEPSGNAPSGKEAPPLPKPAISSHTLISDGWHISLVDYVAHK